MSYALIFPQDRDNTDPEWVNEMKTPATVREMAEAIKALAVQYNIDDFEAEFNTIALSFGATEDCLRRNEFNPLMLLEEGRKEDYKRFIKSLETLDAKYGFQNFHDRCVFLRNAFDRERKGYLFDNVLIQCVPMTFFLPPDVADQFFEQWLDGILEHEESVVLVYENFSGELVKLTVQLKEDEYTLDYTDCRPIDRFAGETPYDAFLVRYFWNEELGWVPVPIHLIKTYAVER